MSAFECQCCGETSPKSYYYECEQCGTVLCHTCTASAGRDGQGFWPEFATALFPTNRCPHCYDSSTGEGGRLKTVFTPPSP